jgi:ATP-dependent helicase HrpB
MLARGGMRSAPPPHSAPALPIEEVLPLLGETLVASRCVVLVAPPGAGKTTRVPLALLASAAYAPCYAPWRGDGRIVVLEPRQGA